MQNDIKKQIVYDRRIRYRKLRTILPASVNTDGTISFETDRLSTYAVAYTDSAVDEDKDEDKDKDEDETVDMYRIYNPNSGEHFYTANVAEKDKLVGLGWRYEGVGWYGVK